MESEGDKDWGSRDVGSLRGEEKGWNSYLESESKGDGKFRIINNFINLSNFLVDDLRFFKYIVWK